VAEQACTTQITCFTSTNVQLLTPEELQAHLHQGSRGSAFISEVHYYCYSCVLELVVMRAHAVVLAEAGGCGGVRASRLLRLRCSAEVEGLRRLRWATLLPPFRPPPLPPLLPPLLLTYADVC
jgi:hypothetical protein